jgi:hypothetical protein
VRWPSSVPVTVIAVTRRGRRCRPRRTRDALLDGADLTTMGPKLGILVLIGAVCVPAGFALFSAGERYARRHGKLKRSG